MKKLLLLIAILFVSVSLFAVPYASKIRVTPTNFPPGAGSSINYIINEAGGTVVIDIIDTGSALTVATFAGTSSVGANTVVWDGTSNNAGGTEVGEGNYRVKITVSASIAAGWVEIASNSSPYNTVWPSIYTTIWNGYSPMDVFTPLAPDADNFGIIQTTCATTTLIVGVVNFNADLSCFDGGDGSTLTLKANWPSPAYTDMWGTDFDPDDAETIWIAGQTEPYDLSKGKWNDEFVTNVTDASNPGLTAQYARSVAMKKIGSDLFAFMCSGNGAIWKCKITGGRIDQTPGNAPVNISGIVVTRYSKNVEFDSSGNLYFASRRAVSDGTGGAVLRWDASVVDTAVAGTLTDANASWFVQFPAGALNVTGVAIARDGSVYASVSGDSDGTVKGVYLVGNVSQASNIITLTTNDRIIPFPSGYTPSTYGHCLGVDYAGNVLFADRSNEIIRCWGPQGTTSIDVLAPVSQNITIEIITSAKNWSLYE